MYNTRRPTSCSPILFYISIFCLYFCFLYYLSTYLPTNVPTYLPTVQQQTVATLGIVELFIFLLHKYYENLNIAREQIFADVHFTLFYTALFNAFQSVSVAIVVSRVSNRLWVKTESLELDHYVEIREEFERVSHQLYPGDHDETTRPGLYQQLRNMGVSLLFPRLRGRYLELLVQVRFHQLRLHFLEGNNLPLTLKVSDYLKRSEESVLIKLVHVSTFAWLFLTAGLNLIYFLMGMVAFATESAEMVGTSLTYIFFCSLVLFILISLLVYNKMTSIFRIIM
jgi:hypothetical protein